MDKNTFDDSVLKQVSGAFQDSDLTKEEYDEYHNWYDRLVKETSRRNYGDPEYDEESYNEALENTTRIYRILAEKYGE